MALHKITIENRNNKAVKCSVLDSIGISGKLPDNVSIQFNNSESEYQKVLNYLRITSFLCKFISSSNNRLLFFYKHNVMGCRFGLEPSLNINLQQREIIRGSSFKLEDETFDESDMFVNSFKHNWNPKKWNIADTQELVDWSYSNQIDVFVAPKQTFEIEFDILEY